MKPYLRYGLFAIAVLIGAISWVKPGYIELSIPVTPHKGTGLFWRESQHSQLAYGDSAGTLYVHRQVGTAYPDTQGWKTPEEVFAFLEPRLRELGWSPAAQFSGEPILPESRLLPESNRKGYFRDSDREARAFVAVFPIGGFVEGFHVVLTTANPSFLKRLTDGLD